MKFLNFFLFLWIIFALLDPDPIRHTGFCKYFLYILYKEGMLGRMQTVLMDNQFLRSVNLEVHSIFFKRTEP
jgi:hypothetical protein